MRSRRPPTISRATAAFGLLQRWISECETRYRRRRAATIDASPTEASPDAKGHRHAPGAASTRAGEVLDQLADGDGKRLQLTHADAELARCPLLVQRNAPDAHRLHVRRNGAGGQEADAEVRLDHPAHAVEALHLEIGRAHV